MLTVRQVAERLNTTCQSVWLMLRGGMLRGVKFGRQWRVREQDLADYLLSLDTKGNKE